MNTFITFLLSFITAKIVTKIIFFVIFIGIILFFVYYKGDLNPSDIINNIKGSFSKIPAFIKNIKI